MNPIKLLSFLQSPSYPVFSHTFNLCKPLYTSSFPTLLGMKWLKKKVMNQVKIELYSTNRIFHSMYLLKLVMFDTRVQKWRAQWFMKSLIWSASSDPWADVEVGLPWSLAPMSRLRAHVWRIFQLTVTGHFFFSVFSPCSMEVETLRKRTVRKIVAISSNPK